MPTTDPQPQGNEQKAAPTTPAPSHAYELHIDVAEAPNEVHKTKPKKVQKWKEPITPGQKVKAVHQKRLVHKIWSTLEWLTTSALIFIVFFFAINYQAYSTLFLSKLNHLRGEITVNPYLQDLMGHPAGENQQPLPMTNTPNQGRKQVPSLEMEIAPPDDRIEIPRINKNVPIVKVNEENLIRRDWSALENDIQGALQNGVVHYPGTAEPGDNGNVVLTGHSSYFVWDPGRFKDVFALLHEVNVGDKIVVYHLQKAYIYQVYETKVVMPDQVDVLTQNGEDRLTLITCTPVGTNLKRLVVLAKPVKG